MEEPSESRVVEFDRGEPGGDRTVAIVGHLDHGKGLGLAGAMAYASTLQLHPELADHPDLDPGGDTMREPTYSHVEIETPVHLQPKRRGNQSARAGKGAKKVRHLPQNFKTPLLKPYLAIKGHRVFVGQRLTGGRAGSTDLGDQFRLKGVSKAGVVLGGTNLARYQKGDRLTIAADGNSTELYVHALTSKGLLLNPHPPR
jgi:hypothetical protein